MTDRTRQTPACPKCGKSHSEVTDGRAHDTYVYRRTRLCLECGNKWNTWEIPPWTWEGLEQIRRLREKYKVIDELRKLLKWIEAPTR